MNKKASKFGAVVGMIFFILAIVFLVLLTKNNGNFAAVLQDVIFWK